MVSRVELPRQELAEFCRRRGIRRLALFGSALGDDFGPESDVDLLVEFRSGIHVGYFDLVDMELELARLIGRPVDLRTPAELSRYFRAEVLSAAETQYESE